MADGINNSNINETYTYKNSELSKYDTDNDGSLSVFEMQQITDSTGQEILISELYGDIDLQEEDVETNVQNLESKLNSAKNNQGVVGSLWNGLKNLTGLGSNTNKCEKAIEDYKNGKITYEEADSIISEFSSKQESSVNFAANIATGITATLVVGSAVLTGGLSLGVIAAAAGVGGATKAGLKFLDRATNKVEGDALDAKQLAKDALSGAVDGAVSVATMGIGTTAVTAKTVTEQTIKETIKQGVISGAKAGAISGAVTGASDYTIEAAFEEDVDFNVKDLAVNTAVTAAGGAVAGGIMGGISSGVQYKHAQSKLETRILEHTNLDEQTIAELSDQADRINLYNEDRIDEATQQVKEVFGDNVEVTSRAKSENSNFEKLAKKFENGKLNSTSDDACFDAIADGLGLRVQMKSLTEDEAKGIIETALKDTGITYQQFINYISGDTLNLDDVTRETLETSAKTIIDELKEKQTQDVFNNLIDSIKSRKIKITDINNYGDEYSSIFTQRQILELVDTLNSVYPGQNITVTTLMDDSYGSIAGRKLTIDADGNTTININETTFTDKGAVKPSGYATSQFNTVHEFEDSTLGLGELQIRGTQLNEFAEVEHVPYDIRQGKIKETDSKYSEIYSIIKGLSKENFNSYNLYLTKVYNWLRLKELGISTSEPLIQSVLTDSGLSEDVLNKISREGLIALSKSH